MEQEQKPHPVVATIFWIFLATFFGGGLAVFVNLFVPFLGEAAFSIIALVLFAEILILFVAGMSIWIISALRRGSEQGAEVVQKTSTESDS